MSSNDHLESASFSVQYIDDLFAMFTAADLTTMWKLDLKTAFTHNSTTAASTATSFTRELVGQTTAAQTDLVAHLWAKKEQTEEPIEVVD
jgi:hypothetical protein